MRECARCRLADNQIENLHDEINGWKATVTRALDERDSLRAQLEQVTAERERLRNLVLEQEARFEWRHFVERDTAEAIAAWLEGLGLDRVWVDNAAGNIRSGAWRKP